MVEYTQHTVKLQDGSLCNFKRRFQKHHTTLFGSLTEVRDGRGKYGKRHELSVLLVILFAGITQGSTTLKDCHLWALHNRKWLAQYVGLSHGIADPTTISRAIQKVEMDSLVQAYVTWQEALYGKETVASFDGKTLNGVHGEGVIKHVLSLFTHEKHQIVGQVGVLGKENEIPAARRLFAQTDISGMLLVADALHTQKETAKEIIAKKAEYLMVVKENQEQLMDDLKLLFADAAFAKEKAQEVEYGHNRYIETEVTLIKDTEALTYFTEWKHLTVVGMVKRTGHRSDKGVKTSVNETVYFLSSKSDLSAKDAAKHLRSHWSIENNLHWQKDYTFLEDRQTLRKATAPLVMTFLRSMAISLFASSSFASVTNTIANFQKNPSLHHTFLHQAGVI